MNRRVTTSYLLTCAVIGVAGGLMLTAANWISTALFAAVPLFAVGIAGLWLLPATIALRLLERPFAGMLVGLISGLVAAPFSGYGFASVATNLWWAFFVEVTFLVVLYRFWTRWQYFAGAVLVGILYPILAWQSFGLSDVAPWAVAGFFALTLASALAGVGLGVLIADRLRAAGVARMARRSAPGSAETGGAEARGA